MLVVVVFSSRSPLPNGLRGRSSGKELSRRRSMPDVNGVVCLVRSSRRRRRMTVTSKNPSEGTNGGVLVSGLCARLQSCRVTDGLHCCRFNYLSATFPRPMTSRDTEVVPSPLVEQQQEDGQRHHPAGTLDPHFPFWGRRLPRAMYAFSETQEKSSGCASLAGVQRMRDPGGQHESTV